METQRSNRSGFSGMGAHQTRGIAQTRALVITAGISAAALLFVIADQIASRFAPHQNQISPTAVNASSTSFAYPSTPLSAAASDATSSDPLSSIGKQMTDQLLNAYGSLKQAGTFSTSSAQIYGTALASSLKAAISYPTFKPSDIKTDADTSYNRMLQYRGDLKTSLEPLTESTQPEYEIFALYVETNDKGILAKLSTIAQNYRNAVSMTSKVVVPQDATAYHIGILNAMSEFATTLDQLVAHANDPYASVAVLQAYDQAESDMLTSFNALITYEKKKQP